MKVKATNKYEEKGIRDNELGRIPKTGEVFEVSEERFKVLSGMNSYGVKFVELLENINKKSDKIAKAVKEVETAKKEPKTEKAIKKSTKKSKQ